ncbi:trypsin 3A1-like [Ochlerotatus camptorhynchus]|uniref:trypsin 3A1-like n=1 Tax=Ochlerotatus camptorhynchus TaxID=644619 RepID=UPI0031CFB3FA
MNTTEDQVNHRSKRIINGNRINISKVPYQVAILWRSYLVCGGSIIAPIWILTAGHCLHDHPTTEMKVRAGSDRRHIGGIMRHVRWTSIHPQYTPKNLLNDVAMILLDASLIMTQDVMCIKLPPSGSFPATGKRALVSGWGMKDANSDKGNPSSFSTLLMFTYLPIMDFGTCRHNYKKFKMSQNSQICAGYPQGGTDACTGDSGGPLALEQYQVGVVSWGVSCAKPKQPGVFTNVGTFREWIDQTTHKFTRPGALKCSRYY